MATFHKIVVSLNYLMYLSSIFIILLASCQSSVAKLPTNQLNETQTPVSLLNGSTISPGITLSPSQSTYNTTIPKPLTLTPRPELTPTPTQMPMSIYASTVVTKCLEIKSQFPENEYPSGNVVLSGVGPPYTTAYILDPKTGKRLPIPKTKNEQISAFHTSPGGNHLVYKKTQGDINTNIPELIIASIDGKEVGKIHGDRSWSGFLGWLNDEQLIIEKRGDRHDTLMILNPFTRNRKEFFSGDFPGIYDTYPSPWGITTPISIDPTMTRLVYAKSQGYQGGISLWDIPNQKEIAFLESRSYIRPPAWSPDGKQVIVNIAVRNKNGKSETTYGQELTSINRDGEIKQLTHLSDFYEHEKVDLSGYSWSPDGRYLAFGIANHPFLASGNYSMENQWPTPRLAVLDMATQKVTNYCIPIYWGDFSPIWSSDSKQLLTFNILNSSLVQDYLVDIQDEYAVQIAESAYPSGWLNIPSK